MGVYSLRKAGGQNKVVTKLAFIYLLKLFCPRRLGIAGVRRIHYEPDGPY